MQTIRKLAGAVLLVSLVATAAAVAQEKPLRYEDEVKKVQEGTAAAIAAFDVADYAASKAALDNTVAPAIANVKAMLQDPGTTGQPGLLARELAIAGNVIDALQLQGSVIEWVGGLEEKYVALATWANEQDGISDEWKASIKLASDSFLDTGDLMLKILDRGKRGTDFTQEELDLVLEWLTLHRAILLMAEATKPI